MVGILRDQAVPLHLRALDRGRQEVDRPIEDREPLGARILVGAGVHHLHTDADAHERPPGRHDVECDGVEPACPQRVHAGAERADTGEDDRVGSFDVAEVGGESGVGADVFERLLRRPQVADSVVEDSQLHEHHPSPGVSTHPRHP